MSNFQQPGIANPEDKFVPADNNGALLLFFPQSLQQGVKTAHGDADAIGCRIVRLNDGRVFENAMVFPQALVTQLRSAVPDGMVLGTLGQGENRKGNPPWLLSPHTEEQVAQAEAWMAANPRVQQAPQAPAPAAPQWGAQQAPAAPQWGNPPAAPQAPAWGAPAASMPPSAPAPAAPQWGAPAAPEGVPGTAPAAWQNAGAPVPPPVAAPPADPALVAALTQKGVAVPPGITHDSALQLWALYGG